MWKKLSDVYCILCSTRLQSKEKRNLGEHMGMRNRKNEINWGNKTLKHFLLFCGNSTQICGNPLLEFMLWKQGWGGRQGITAFSLSLQDHNDDKESITVLQWWYAHSWGDSQSAGCPGSLYTLPHFSDNFRGCSLSAIGEDQYRLQQHREGDFWQRKSIRDDSTWDKYSVPCATVLRAWDLYCCKSHKINSVSEGWEICNLLKEHASF